MNSLRPGQTGCLRAGTYYGNVRFPRGGRAGSPITLMSAPGESATIVGRIWIPKGSDHVRVTGLHLDGRNAANLPSPGVNSADDEFVNDDVTNYHTGICFELGSDGPWRATRTLIGQDRIHDCGVLPATNHQHGIYVANSARIVGNVIYDNADRGIQLYWNAQRTTIVGNIIDRNGEGIDISGADGFESSNNLIINNVITNSLVRADVESWWPDGGSKGKATLWRGTASTAASGRSTSGLADLQRATTCTSTLATQNPGRMTTAFSQAARAQKCSPGPSSPATTYGSHETTERPALDGAPRR